MHRLLLSTFVLVAATGVLADTGPAAAAPTVAAGRLSVSSAEAQGNDDSFAYDVSEDGRFVLFSSDASNLVPGDTNGQPDVFVRDTVAGTTTRVSVGSAEQQGNGDAFPGNLSDDGRLATFTSASSNLIANDTNAEEDVFLRDLVAGTTVRVSVSDGEVQGNDRSVDGELSGDGTKVAFASEATNLVTGDTNDVRDIFLRDLGAGTTQRLSVDSSEGESNGQSNLPRVNRTGTVVTFASQASDLIGANDTNGVQDVFARQVGGGTTFRVSVGDGGQQANAQTFNGDVDDAGTRFVFASEATNLVTGDGNGDRDVFYRSIAVGETGVERISVDTEGGDASNFSSEPSMTGDSRFVGFTSRASDLVAEDTNGSIDDAFVRDRLSGVTTLMSARPGTELDGDSAGALLMASGSVVFSSEATNLADGDTNDGFDVFVAGEVCDGRVVTVDLGHGDTPTAGPDVILGTPSADTVDGLGGADRFCGAGGKDVFSGGGGNDRAFGGPGNDVLKGQDGADRLDGAAGNDRLVGGNQNDSLFGVAGDDVLEGGNGNDAMNGGTNTDTCKGQAGSDRAATCETVTGVP